MIMNGINHYSFLNLCIIHNQAKESSFVSQYTLYRIITLISKYIASLNKVKYKK